MDMTKEEKLDRLNRWVEDHSRMDAQMQALKAVVGMLAGSPLFHAVWDMFDSYTEAVAANVGDTQKWLDWYLWENDMGKKWLKVRTGPDTEPIIVDSTEKLLCVIECCAE
jgi:hypothetical protein